MAKYAPKSLPLLILLALSGAAQTPQLLFKSGFEQSTYTDIVSGPAYNQTPAFHGTDNSTGLNWDNKFWGGTGFVLNQGLTSSQSNPAPGNATDYIENTFEPVTGPYGNSTTALKMNIKKPSPNTCCTQDTFETFSIQVPIKDVYVAHWMKFNPEMSSQMQALGTNYWRMLFEMKTASDYRIQADILWNGQPYFQAHGDNNGLNNISPVVWYWTNNNTTVPVPLNQWFYVEYYLHRAADNTGRFYWAVNGQTIVDYRGSTYGSSMQDISALMFTNLYGPNPTNWYQWLDDIQIYTLPPCANLPCGAPGGGTTSTDTQPPSVPTNLIASAASSSQINLSWAASTDNVGVTGYRIYRNGGTTPLAATSTNSYLDTGLDASTAYTYMVSAYDAAGNLSPTSNSATATTQTPPVSLVRGKTPTSSTTIYNAQYIADGDLTSSNYTDAGAACQWVQFDLGTAYALNGAKLWHYFGDARTYYSVIVQLSNSADFSSGVTTVFNNDSNNSCGQGPGADALYAETASGKQIVFNSTNARYVRFWSNGNTANQFNHYTEIEVYGAIAMDTVPPSTPAGLSATPYNNYVRLSWTASTDNVGVTGYWVYRNGGANPIATVTAPATTYVDTAVSASTPYTYTVAAFDAAGNVSLQSSLISAVTLASSTSTAGALAVTLVSPTDGATFSIGSAIPLSVTITGQPTSVSYYLDGVAVATATASPWSASLDTSGIRRNTPHTITAVATGASGATATSSGARIRIR